MKADYFRFPHEHLPLVLFVPAAVLGHLSIQFFLSRYVSPIERAHLERYHYYSQLLLSAAFMLALQALRIRSAYIFAGITSFMLSGILLPGVWGYFVPILLMVAGSVEAVTSVSRLSLPVACVSPADRRTDTRHLHTPHRPDGQGRPRRLYHRLALIRHSLHHAPRIGAALPPPTPSDAG